MKVNIPTVSTRGATVLSKSSFDALGDMSFAQGKIGANAYIISLTAFVVILLKLLEFFDIVPVTLSLFVELGLDFILQATRE